MSVLDALEPVVPEAVAGCLQALRSRAARSGQPAGMIEGALEVPVMRFRAVLEAVREREPGIDGEVEAEAAQLSEMPFPDICRALTAHLWQRSGISGPAVVLGLGSTPYLATALEAPRVREAVEALIAGAPERYGAGLRAVDHFAGISYMSFFGPADAAGDSRRSAGAAPLLHRADAGPGAPRAGDQHPKVRSAVGARGRLAVEWPVREEGERRLLVEWQEEDLGRAGEAPSPEASGGYRRQLIDRALPYALQARTSYDVKADGLRCTIDLPPDRPEEAG